MRKISMPSLLGLMLLLAGAAGTAHGRGLEPMDDAVIVAEGPGGFPVRYSIRREFSHGLGYDDGFTQLGMFTPLAEPCGISLLFADLQPLIDDRGNFGINAGLGYRLYSPLFERTFGVYGYFDYRESRHHSFRQGMFGVDSLGTWVDFRANFYFPDEAKKALPAHVAPSFFADHHLIASYERALAGMDGELGVVLPELFGTQTRLLSGVYHFDTDASDTTGGRIRVESHWTSNVHTDVSINRDSHFGTTVMVSLGFNWQPESYTGRRMPQIESFRRGPGRHITHHASDRLAEPTRRLPMIVVGRGQELVRTTAGDPLTFFHVYSGAAAGGDGTFEQPFQTLDQALSQAQDGIGVDADIVYTPLGGVYQPLGLLTVPSDVQLLSNAPLQRVQSALGPVVLPGSGASPDFATAPLILGSVQLSDRSTINGFRIEGTAATLAEQGTVFVDGRSDFAVANNRIVSLADGIRITGSQNGSITGNQILSPVESGIAVDGSGALTIAGNWIDEAGVHAIHLENVSRTDIAGNFINAPVEHAIAVTGGTDARISGNQIQGAGATGIRLFDNGRADVVNNWIDGAVEHGIDIGGTNFVGTISGNQVFDAQTGIHADVTGDFQGLVSGNLLAENRARGLDLNAARFIGSSISANTFVDNVGEGAAVLVRGPGTSSLNIQNNLLADNHIDALGPHRELFVRGEGTSTLNVQLHGNTSLNVVPAGEFNFDFSRAPTATVQLQIPAANFGTVGSADATVSLPATVPTPPTQPLPQPALPPLVAPFPVTPPPLPSLTPLFPPIPLPPIPPPPPLPPVL